MHAAAGAVTLIRALAELLARTAEVLPSSTRPIVARRVASAKRGRWRWRRWLRWRERFWRFGHAARPTVAIPPLCHPTARVDSGGLVIVV